MASQTFGEQGLCDNLPNKVLKELAEVLRGSLGPVCGVATFGRFWLHSRCTGGGFRTRRNECWGYAPEQFPHFEHNCIFVWMMPNMCINGPLCAHHTKILGTLRCKINQFYSVVCRLAYKSTISIIQTGDFKPLAKQHWTTTMTTTHKYFHGCPAWPNKRQKKF